MHIIPAMDLLGGQVVRLMRGSYEKPTVYHNDPVALGKQFEQQGFTYLHMVDLDGARTGKVHHWQVLQDVAQSTRLSIDFSGGIDTLEEAHKAFTLGAHQLMVGSKAVNHPEETARWIGHFGGHKIVLAADVRAGKVATAGWTETSDLDLFTHLERFYDYGIGRIMVTDISRDGTLEGPAIELYAEIRRRMPDLELVASGGVRSYEDLEQLQLLGVWGTIVGRALYEGTLSRMDWESFLNN